MTIEPVLHELATAIKEHADDSKMLIFLPLFDTSYRFAAILREHGLAAVAICGDSSDRKEILLRFTSGETQVLRNAMLLIEGYDGPSIDRVVCLRLTTIRAFYPNGWTRYPDTPGQRKVAFAGLPVVEP
jgi:superfamily II DNA or RNA helicase